jgi:hypothetical protein
MRRLTRPRQIITKKNNAASPLAECRQPLKKYYTTKVAEASSLKIQQNCKYKKIIFSLYLPVKGAEAPPVCNRAAYSLLMQTSASPWLVLAICANAPCERSMILLP